MLKNTVSLTGIPAKSATGDGAPPPLTGIAGLFQGGEAGYWYDFSDTATVYESYTDESTNTPATFGGKVAYVKDKSGNANNLSQSFNDKKPIYGRQPADGDIRNVQLDSGDMDISSANWQSSLSGYNATTTNDAVPVTGLVATLLTHPSGASFDTLQGAGLFTTGQDVTVSMYLKYVTGSTAEKMFIGFNDGTFVIADFKDGTIDANATGVTSTISSASNGWYRVACSWTVPASGGRLQHPLLVLTDANNQYANVLSGTDTALITGYQAEYATSASGVQVVGATTDNVFEPTQDHLYFLVFDGDDGFTVTKNFGTGVDALSLFVSAKIDDPTYDGTLVEYSDAIGSATQAYRLHIDSANDQIKFAAKGLFLRVVSNSIASYSETRLATAVTDISDDYIRFYKDGVLVASSNDDLSSGTFAANKDLNIGCRNASSSLTGGSALGFKGYIYQIVGVGTKMTDTNDLGTINTAVAAKAGLTV